MHDESGLASFSDHHLLARLAELVRKDQEQTVSLVRYIDEIDQRELWAKLGHPSMFDFCVVRFRMSESTAGKRIGAARTARRFPAIFDMIARGEIHLSGIHRLKAHLSQENHRQVLHAAKHKTIKQIEQLVAELAPQPDVPTRIRALPQRRPAVPTTGPRAPNVPLPCAAPAAPTPGSHEPTTSGSGLHQVAAQRHAAREPAAQHCAAREPRAPDPTPLAPRRYKLELTLDQEGRDILQQLQNLLAHQIPDGDPAAIVKRALLALLG
jgi:hypothetical protein